MSDEIASATLQTSQKAIEVALELIKMLAPLAQKALSEVYHKSVDGINTVGGAISNIRSMGTVSAKNLVAEAQKAGGEAAFIDAEHALDPVYAANLGVDVDSLLVSQPDNGEQALEIAEALVRSGAIDIVVVDSVAALVPRSEIEGEMGDSHVGQHARLMSQALRKLAGAINKSNTIIIFINQLREKIGVMYGNPETTTGGRALKFYASMRMDVRKAETIKGANGEFVGSRTRVKIVKNKVAPPFKEAEFDIIYGEGISKVGELLDIAVAMDVIHKSGAWFSYGDSRLGQGRENVKELLKNDQALYEEVKSKVYADKEKMLQACKSGVSKKGGKGKASAKVSADEAPAENMSAKAKLDIAVDDE